MGLMGGVTRQMENQYTTNRQWSDKFLPEMKSILGRLFIGEAPKEEDAWHNTDLIVLKLEPLRFACRVRRYKYYGAFKNEFTFRAAIPNNGKTELAKIIEGYGDYFFYGFASEDESHLHSWIIGDLKVFRLWFNRCLTIGNLPWERKSNNDGSSDFLVFKLTDLPKEFIAHSFCVESEYVYN